MRAPNSLEVLVVGGGAVGMFCGLRLATAGVHVKVIDQDSGAASRSYACALHPATLHLMDECGILPDLLEAGVRVNTVALYDGTTRKTEIDLSAHSLRFPFVLVLPQSELETVLERRLAQSERAGVQWNCRLADVSTTPAGAAATLETLSGTGMGYSVAEWEMVVDKRSHLTSDFVIGADGAKSLVRRSLAIPYEPMGPPELFEVYEFDCDLEESSEVGIVLDEFGASALWPLGAGRYRWSLQLPYAAAATSFPDKERHSYVIREEHNPNDTAHYLTKMLKKRAPWFRAEIQDVDWWRQVKFERRLAQRFGRDRCWLAGDAAHQTGPIGVQSMNIGLREADELAERMASILHNETSGDSLEEYHRTAHAEWTQLFNPNSSVVAGNQSGEWLRQHAEKLKECLPASGGDLAALLQSLGILFQPSPA